MATTQATFRSDIEAGLVAPGTYAIGGKQYRPIALRIEERPPGSDVVIYLRLTEWDLDEGLPPIDLEALSLLTIGDRPGSPPRTPNDPSGGIVVSEARLDDRTKTVGDNLKVRWGDKTYKYVFRSRLSVDANIRDFRDFLEAALNSQEQHKARQIQNFRAAIDRVADPDPLVVELRKEAQEIAVSLLGDGDRESSVAWRWLAAYYVLGIGSSLGLVCLLATYVDIGLIVNHVVSAFVWGVGCVVTVEILKRILSRAQRHHSTSQVYRLNALEMIEASNGPITTREEFEAKKAEVRGSVGMGVRGCHEPASIFGNSTDVAGVMIREFKHSAAARTSF